MHESRSQASCVGALVGSLAVASGGGEGCSVQGARVIRIDEHLLSRNTCRAEQERCKVSVPPLGQAVDFPGRYHTGI